MAKKWIIEKTRFVYGNVERHYQLAKDRDDIKCGGFWHIDKENNILYLYARSVDYGVCKKEKILETIKNNNYPKDLAKLTWKYSVSEDFKMALKNSEVLK